MTKIIRAVKRPALVLAALMLAVLGATAAAAATASVPTQVTRNGCRYSAYLHPLGGTNGTITVTKDTCHRDMRADIHCTQPAGNADFHGVGVWRTTVGKTSTATCPAYDVGVDHAGWDYHYLKFVVNGITGYWKTVTGYYCVYQC